jgi:hypothetical protein
VDLHSSRNRRHLNVGLTVSLGLCLAVWLTVLHLLGVVW